MIVVTGEVAEFEQLSIDNGGTFYHVMIYISWNFKVLIIKILGPYSQRQELNF